MLRDDDSQSQKTPAASVGTLALTSLGFRTQGLGFKGLGFRVGRKHLLDLGFRVEELWY